MMETKDLKC